MFVKFVFSLFESNPIRTRYVKIWYRIVKKPILTRRAFYPPVTLYNSKDIGKYKVDVVKEKIKSINPFTKIKTYKKKITNKNLNNIIKSFDVIVDGSDNFKTKFLLNKYSIKYKKNLIVGAISKFDGHVFTFDFKQKKTACLKCFYQSEPSDKILNCEI